MDVRVGLWRRLSAKELMLLNCGVGEDSWESLGLQGDPTSPFWRRSALGLLWREWCWSQYFGHLMEELTHWKRLWCWEGLGAGGEGDDGGWDGWMASDSMDVSLSELRELVIDWDAWRAAIHGVAKSRTRLSDWTELHVEVLSLRLCAYFLSHVWLFVNPWIVAHQTPMSMGILQARILEVAMPFSRVSLWPCYRGWDGWMASPTWVWTSSESWWWTGKPGMLQSMGSQIVRHDWVTELNWTQLRSRIPQIFGKFFKMSDMWTQPTSDTITLHEDPFSGCIKENHMGRRNGKSLA